MTDLPPYPPPDPADEGQPGSSRRRRPERLGRFVVTDWLGMGGMGTVYRATDPQFDRPVALKVMSGALSHVPEFRERFRREATALARVTNPHVITVYDHGEQDGVLWLATQFVSGGELGDLIRDRGPLPAVLALDVAAQVADALAASHAIGVLHRDVKPGNVLLRDADAPRLHAYLCDFGIADTGAAGLTVTGGVAGTWEYLAPERMAGAAATASTDIYALGCLLWTCLLGRPPFTGSDVNVMLGHSEAPVPQLLETTPLHRDLNALFTGCLAKRPDERIPSAAQLRDRLDSLRTRVESSPAGVGQILPAPPGPPPGGAGPARRRRTTAAIAGATALVLVGGGLATWLVLRGGSDDPGAGGTLPTATAGVRGDVDGDGLGDLVVKDYPDPETDDPNRTVVLRSEKDAFA
ncbi:MAG: serine/threonine protein kinase, partial [Nocardioidaceae bacterium]|nr:serine/threonine protein kinase [Nocardioidaceae bacterium]